jgi:hypothetical protein
VILASSRSAAICRCRGGLNGSKHLGSHFPESSGSIRLGESPGVVPGVRAGHKRRLAWEADGGRPTIILAKITAANLTSLVAKALSGVDAGQSHPGIRHGECSPDPDANSLA